MQADLFRFGELLRNFPETSYINVRVSIGLYRSIFTYIKVTKQCIRQAVRLVCIIFYKRSDLDIFKIILTHWAGFFKVCKSVYHRTIQINHQPDATVCQFIIQTFVYNSTCFGHFPAHHQDLNDCSGSLWFYLRIMVTVIPCSWSGRPAGRPDHEHSTTVTTIRR